MKNFITHILISNLGLSSLVFRIPIGLIFMAHGAQKLFGWFGGYGLEGTGQWMSSIGLTPGYVMACLAGSGEFFGGALLVIGLLTRPAALVTAFTMIIAIVSVHLPHGFFLSNNGYEYALALFIATATLFFQGAGKYSIDHLIVKRVR